ncbi:MAG: elongation factor P maturation arginine rhamnosyltransferase EarP [Succinatimonas sp.]|nr:elongation factor P maturation arginine rhamnosyltransferase EarP [Succinatimonas sp.]
MTSSIHIFCDVIDNFGDAGFCLRLSRDLCKFYNVTLFCNNLDVLKKITNKEDLSLSKLQICSWIDSNDSYQVPNIVIEAFSCRAPDYLIEKYKKTPPLIIELEYLTAEPFADDCHGLTSFSDGLPRYFFFPGFTSKTGGLIFETEFIESVNKFPNISTSSTKKLTLFSYHEANYKSLIKALSKSKFNFEINVFEGLQLEAINKNLNTNLHIGESITIDNLNFKVQPMVSQREYDQMLISSDLNLVRGEDSIVRAMFCGKPFLWNIYPQKEDAHKFKLEALFARMKEFIAEKDLIEQIEAINLSYNNYGLALETLNFDDIYTSWASLSKKWSFYLQSLGSLTTNLHKFIENHLKDGH